MIIKVLLITIAGSAEIIIAGSLIIMEGVTDYYIVGVC
jgi:hypothetical protein